MQDGSPLARVSRRFTLVGTLAAVLFAADDARAGAPGRLPVELPPADRARLVKVTEAATITTRFETQPFAARREVFEFLLDHPEFASHVTRALRLGRYKIWRTNDGLMLDDGWGARGRFEVVHAGRGVRVMYARGVYEQRVLPDITGEAVVLIEYATRPGAGGRGEIATAISGFVKLDSRWLAFAGRVASPIAATKAEQEAQRLGKVFARASRAIEQDPAAVYEAVRQRPDVPRRELEAFRQLLNLARTSSP